MSAAIAGVPDLLRRFVPAPHSAKMIVARQVFALVRTNDRQLLTAMQQITAAGDSDTSRLAVRMTVIRDVDTVAEGGRLTLVSAWPLATLFAGYGTVLTLDFETLELHGFLAPSVTAEELMDRLLPLILDPVCQRSGCGTLATLDEQ